LIAAFALSATTFALLARQQLGLPGLKPFLAAFVSSLGFFFQLRIADEWKDSSEDARFRAYRPVPRGLISLRELAAAAMLAGALQLPLAFWLGPGMVGRLLIVWAFIALMSKEFFLHDWLRRRPLLYMLSHMLVVPLIYWYDVECVGPLSGQHGLASMALLLAAGFFSGILVEIGRKLRAPEEEEAGVATYSVTWGIRKSVLAWNSALLLAFVFGGAAAASVGAVMLTAAILFPAFALALGCSLLYKRRPTPRYAKLMELTSGAWTLVLYMVLGPLVVFFKLAAAGRHP
jgi:4-hydroxybenzoate polyprenyltransferase